MNIVIATTAIVTSVDAAFLLSGGRNAGTPFDTASTPVIAVHPFEKAVSSMNVDSIPTPAAGTAAGAGTGTSVPVAYRHAPTASIVRMLTMKKYVGAANRRPDSRMPRRLPNMRIRTKTSDIVTGLR